MKKAMLLLVTSVFPMLVLASEKSPYTGQEFREIKTLTQQQVEGYLSGKGLGYGKAGELNQYPGPRHVLDFAEELALTPVQISQTQATFDAMQTAAVYAGKKLIAKERELDLKFSNRTINHAELKKLLADIGVLRSQIRYAHLSAHLEQRALLSEQQIEHYDQLRGYGKPHHSERKHTH